MTPYQLWRKHGSRHKLKVYLIATILEDGGLLKTERNSGGLICTILKKFSDIHVNSLVNLWRSHSLFYQLAYSRRAVRRWSKLQRNKERCRTSFIS